VLCTVSTSGQLGNCGTGATGDNDIEDE